MILNIALTLPECLFSGTALARLKPPNNLTLYQFRNYKFPPTMLSDASPRTVDFGTHYKIPMNSNGCDDDDEIPYLLQPEIRFGESEIKPHTAESKMS
ncbi:jg5157 [Pararge aegeria aegeria]|uniref:Jg5157 protein n=1 Tax=Pararge aegeria aegeria TaxID=348720 RepID=A0A8S4S0J2_9NEOP|nr:jg5157 [Pararge aegeria aegeria]